MHASLMRAELPRAATAGLTHSACRCRRTFSPEEAGLGCTYWNGHDGDPESACRLAGLQFAHCAQQRRESKPAHQLQTLTSSRYASACFGQQCCTGTLRDASATRAMLFAKGVRRSSVTNWLSCECVRLQKMTCRSQPANVGILAQQHLSET